MNIHSPCEQASEMLLMALPDAVVFADAGRVIRRVNPAFTEIFGYAAEEVIGRSARIIYSDLSLFREQGRLRFNINYQGMPTPYDMTYKRKNGELFNAMSLATTVRDGSGQATGFMLLLRDVTANKQMESDYIRLATAVAQATESVVITDAKGRIQYVNPSFEKNTGYTRADAIGRTPALLKSGAHDDAFYRDIWATITSGEPWAGQIKNRRKDGSFFIEDCIISPVFSESGEIINFVGVKHDITRTLELEEQTRQSQRIESLGRLAGGVAHDINNMLFPILGHTDLLLQDLPRSSLFREPIEEVHKAAEKIRMLVRQLLAFGRKQTLEMGPADLNHIIRNFEKLLRKTIREDVAMEIIQDPDLPLVLADTGQVEQIIMNLVVNAHLAMPNGGRLRIETGTGQMPGMPGSNRGGPAGKAAGEHTGYCAFIRITDNGQGMDGRTRSRIFEPFFTTRPEGQGTGLGLSTVYGIVKQHKGQIRVQSEPGKGSCFTVSLPIFTGTDCPAPCSLCRTSAETCPAAAKDRKKARKVMLAEDNPMAMGIAKSTLKRLGYDVVMAGDGKACKAFLSGYRGSLDLLLSDVVMPGINGQDLHRHVVRVFPEAKTLFMSGYSHDVISQYDKGEKGLDFLAKPFSSRQLSDKLTSLFQTA